VIQPKDKFLRARNLKIRVFQPKDKFLRARNLKIRVFQPKMIDQVEVLKKMLTEWLDKNI